jgi:HlyD family secretion protein
MARRAVAVLIVILLVGAVLAAVVAGTRDDSNGAWSGLRDRLGLGGESDTLTVSGYLEGRAVTLATELAGRVRSVAVENGDAVNAGDVVLELQDDATAAQADQAAAALDAAKSRLEQLREGAPPAQVGALSMAVGEARRAAASADAAFRAARAAGQSAAAVDALQTRMEVAQATLQVAEAQLALASAGASTYQVRSAEAAVRAAEARVRGLSLLTDRLTVRAPITGTMTQMLVRPGEAVAQGRPLAEVTRLDPLEVVVYVPEADLDRVEVGQGVELSVEGFDKTYDGEVVAIAEQAEYTPKNVQTTDDRKDLVFAVTIRVPNDDGDLRPGVPVDAAIDVS